MSSAKIGMTYSYRLAKLHVKAVHKDRISVMTSNVNRFSLDRRIVECDCIAIDNYSIFHLSNANSVMHFVMVQSKVWQVCT